MTTVYVTRWALEHGILEWEHRKGNDWQTLARGPLAPGEKPKSVWLWGDQHHSTREAAIDRAEEMRDERIASLRRQLAKLKAMTFEVEDDPKLSCECTTRNCSYEKCAGSCGCPKCDKVEE